VFDHAYFSPQYFPTVWFAPADASAVPPELLHQPKPESGGALLSRRRSGGWKKPVFPAAPTPQEDEEALLLLIL